MPRNVRNFWIELDVDGKKERIATGPKNSGGGFEMTVRMRDKGGIDTPIWLRGYVSEGGTLVLNVLGKKGPLKVIRTLRDDPSPKPKRKRKPHGQTRALKHWLPVPPPKKERHLKAVGDYMESDAMEQVNDDRPEDV